MGGQKAAEIALFLKKIKYKSELQGSKLASNLSDYKAKLERNSYSKQQKLHIFPKNLTSKE